MNAIDTGWAAGVRRVRRTALVLVLLFLLAGASGYFIRALTTPTSVTHITAVSGPAAASPQKAPAVDPAGDGHRQIPNAPAAPHNPAGDGHLPY